MSSDKMSQESVAETEEHYYGDPSGNSRGLPSRAFTEEDGLAWSGKAACLYSVQDRPPLDRFWTPDAFNFDDVIGPETTGVHRYASPLAFVGITADFQAPDVYDDLVNTTGELAFPLKYLRNIE